MTGSRSLRVGPIARLSLGLISLLVSLMLLADMVFDFVPQHDEAQRVQRQRVAENLAVQITSLLEGGQIQVLGRTIELVMVRDPEIRSINVRRNDGATLVQRGQPGSWQSPSGADASTTDRVRVPIHSGPQAWGRIEVQFAAADRPALLRWFEQPVVRMAIFLAFGGFLLCYGYLRRALQYLNPSAAVPDRVRKAFDVLGEGLLIVDQQARIVLANKSFRALHPDAEDELNGRRVDDLTWLTGNASGASDAVKPWTQTLRSGEAVAAQPLELRQPDGAAKNLLVSSAPISDNKGRARGCLVTFDDVTAVHRANEELRQAMAELQKSRARVQEQNTELRRLASRDPMTGCYNRRAFFELAAEILTQAHRGQSDLCCLMVDIDHFKRVNDTYGHAVGDQVIQVVAKRLTAGIRESDLLARFGGEEFCLLLPGAAPSAALAIAERIRAGIESDANTEIRGCAVATITASFGLASWSVASRTIEALIDQADQALYRSKQSGRNRVTVWERSMAAEEGADAAARTMAEAAVEIVEPA